MDNRTTNSQRSNNSRPLPYISDQGTCIILHIEGCVWDPPGIEVVDPSAGCQWSRGALLPRLHTTKHTEKVISTTSECASVYGNIIIYPYTYINLFLSLLSPWRQKQYCALHCWSTESHCHTPQRRSWSQLVRLLRGGAREEKQWWPAQGIKNGTKIITNMIKHKISHTHTHTQILACTYQPPHC